MTSRKPLAVIVLAAGQGTRMRSERPKVMHELAGLPMVRWLLKTVETLNPDRVIVVVGPDMEALEAAVQPHDTVVQEVRDGTGGAAKIAAQALGDFEGDVLIVLGDAPLVRAETLQDLVTTRHASEVGVSLLGCVVENPAGYGRVVVSEDMPHLVDRIVEDKDANAEEKAVCLVNTGAFCVDGMYLQGWLAQITNENAQEEFYITDLPVIAARDGFRTAFAVAQNACEVQGCNTRNDLSQLETSLRLRLCAEAMMAGAQIIDPATTYLHHDTVIAADVLIEPNVFFGPGVSVAQGAHIKAFSHLEEARIGAGAKIGPFARLRGGVDIEDGVKIGTYVEVKKSTIGAQSSIAHLSYVGDCTMGARVNFGAGAITANYDGFEKNQTQIGDDVMVGSNVNLIAPVTVGEGAFLAAGSTIGKDVPADALAIERSTHDVREGWAQKRRAEKVT